MKNMIALLILISAIACNEPMQVTSNPDDRAATSGTLGSANAENQIPNETRDTANRLDSSIHK
jgi:hypothetical protein